MFGGLCARRDKSSVTHFRTRKTGALLALLAINGQRQVRREEAIEWLWPGESSESGRSRLRMALTDIRKQFENGNVGQPSILLADRYYIHLASSLYVTDKDEFEALIARAEQTEDAAECIRLLTTATSLYKGELLAGYDELWIAGERQRQADLYLLALRRLVKALATNRQFERAIEYARRCVEADPLREESHRAIMQLYVAAGRPVMAQQQYRQLATTLQNELGILPSASTRQLLDQCVEALKRAEEATPPSTTNVTLQTPSPSANALQTGILSASSATIPAQTTDEILPIPNNLPQQVTSFIGREEEMADVSARLSHTRLLTLTGSGGCGKTRLALETARSLRRTYTDGVWLVELAPLTDAAFVPQAVAAALGIQEEAERSLQHTLITFLKSKAMLIVLDNCEHLLMACARCAETLLRDCQNVTLLASSREPMNIAGESLYRVPSLSMPNDHNLLTLHTLNNYSAVRLFMERAEAVSAAFRVEAKNLPALAQICARLDGIPLAIELAAARVRSLSLEEINSKLDDRFHLLTGGSRTALPRHQTLRALIDYSYDVLNDQEKTLLRCLSVFAGGWTLEAAEVVCNYDVFDLLSTLVDKSLVVAYTQQEVTRYRLLETVRLYAAEKLLAEEDAHDVRDHYDNYFLALAMEAGAKLAGAEAKAGLDRLEAEYDNLRAIFARPDRGPTTDEKLQADEEYAAKYTDVILRLCAALWQFWQVRGYYSEGLTLCAKALSRQDAQARTIARAKVLTTAGNLALCLNDNYRAGLLFTEYLEICRELKDDKSVAGALNNLGIVYVQQGNYDRARLLYEEALRMNRQAGNKMWEAHNLGNLGLICINEGDLDRARLLFERRLMLYQELEDRLHMAHALADLGYVAVEEESYQEARLLLEDSLSIATELGSKRDIAGVMIHLGRIQLRQGEPVEARQFYDRGLLLMRELEDLAGIASLLRAIAELQSCEGRHEEAMHLWGAEEAMRSQVDVQCSPREKTQIAACQKQSRGALGTTRCTEAFNYGYTLSWKQSVELALAEPERHLLIL